MELTILVTQTLSDGKYNDYLFLFVFIRCLFVICEFHVFDDERDLWVIQTITDSKIKEYWVISRRADTLYFSFHQSSLCLEHVVNLKVKKKHRYIYLRHLLFIIFSFIEYNYHYKKYFGFVISVQLDVKMKGITIIIVKDNNRAQLKENGIPAL